MSSTTSVAHSWEAQKENAAPLERGRNVAKLGLRQSSIDKEALHEQVQKYEALVSPSEEPKVTQMGNDPLADWLQYIKFYQNNFPSDTRDNFLLIERCVRALAKMKQYRDDDRFVSVCAKYADKTKDPNQVFKYLHQQKIGGQTALFWIAWAFVAEKESDFPFAEQIFKKGISKKAEPLQMLKLRHQQFQRRMSRHWLNSSKTNDQLNDEYDTEEHNRPSRSTLGGVSTQRLRRNDRSQNRINNPSQRQPSNRRFGANQNNQSVNKKGSFSIFVEEQGENAYNLDQDYAENDRSVIARDSDRRKENILAAERWNERGGIQSNFQKSKVSKPPPAPFSVFVDEECAAKNEREEQQQEALMDRQRQVRDERTFKERDSEGMAEKIFRDPVKFLKDPNRYKSENRRIPKHQRPEDLKKEVEKPQRRSRTGFSKRLLKNENGEEQCFEEARAKANSFKSLIGTSSNFNQLLNVNNLDKNSNGIDEEGYADMSMCESMADTTQHSKGSNNMLERKQYEAETCGKRLFKNFDGSFDAGLNQTAISHASSTINSIDIPGVGVLGKQEEETINTKFAMKELSMMFSSPAVEIGSARRRQNYSSNSRIDESVAYMGKADASIGDVGDGILLDNSICNTASEKLCDEQTPFVDCTSLRDLKDGNKENKKGNAGFVIFEDDNIDDKSKDHDTQSATGFQIYDESEQNSQEVKKFQQESGDTASITDAIALLDTSLGVNQTESFSSDEGSQDIGSKEFQIYDENEQNIQEVKKFQHEGGDTASIADAIALLDTNLGVDQTESFSSDEGSQDVGSKGDETATMSLFNQIFKNESITSRNEIASEGGKNVENMHDPEESLKPQTVVIHSAVGTNRERLKRSYDNIKRVEIDYDTYIRENSKQALRNIQLESEIPDQKIPLLSCLIAKGRVLNFPSVAIPKLLRRKNLTSNMKVWFGRYGDLILKKELGRGTFGRVILTNTKDSRGKGTVAIKVQSPTGSLAWEFVILQRLEKRILSNKKQAVDYAFPRPINFISLADGGILSMSAVSKTGLNLIDLSNFYTLKLGTSIPEIIAFHYMSVALKVVEVLHSKGKVLHCDVKPDNFVLSTCKYFDSMFHRIDFSSLTLVDFGSAVDLLQNPDYTTENVNNVFFNGNTARKDMQCIAMRNNQSWSFDADAFGLSCCAHVLLYGKHMEIRKNEKRRWMPSTSLKRYWHQDLWNEFFDTLLNLDCNSRSPDSQVLSMHGLHKKIDAYLETESNTLYQLLSRQANMLPESRGQIS